MEGIPVVEEIKILGIWFRADPSDDDQYRLNFRDPLIKIRHICESWSNRQLSLKGKVTVANSLLVSVLQYPTAVTHTPTRVLKEYSKILKEFIWDGKHPKIAFNTLVLPIDRGGLNLMDLHTRIQTNMLQWVKRVLQNPESNTAHYLNRMTGCTSLTDYFSSKRPDGPEWVKGHKFYEKLLQVWNCAHCFQPTDEQGVRNEIIWHNRWITSGGVPLNFLPCQRAGITKIAHVCHASEPRLMSHNELNAAYGTSISFLDMLRIRLGTPLHWRRMITANWAPRQPQAPVFEVQLAPGERRDILSLSAKGTYMMIMQGKDHEPTALKTWQREVEEIRITDKDVWRRACVGVYRATRETKLQSFHYKMLHRIIPCNVYLAQVRIKTSMWCPFCDESDTLTHFLCTCAKIRPFWETICKWFHNADNLYLDRLTTEEYMWGLDRGAHKANLINAITLMIKHYIYRQKLFYSGDLCAVQWLQELRTKLRTEDWIARKTGSTTRFRKWERIVAELG